MAHTTFSVLIIFFPFSIVPPSDSGKNRIATVTGTYSGKNTITMGTDNGKNRIATETDSGKNKIADSIENKDNEMITNSKGRKKQIENQATVTEREKDFSSRHEKQKELSEDYSSSEENGEDECQEQKEDVPSISVSDVEIQLKNLEITPCETKNIEGQLKKLAISLPEGELCERSPMGNDKHHRNNYNPYVVSSPFCFSAVYVLYASTYTAFT
jgi:hypothetical protein